MYTLYYVANIACIGFILQYILWHANLVLCAYCIMLHAWVVLCVWTIAIHAQIALSAYQVVGWSLVLYAVAWMVNMMCYVNYAACKDHSCCTMKRVWLVLCAWYIMLHPHELHCIVCTKCTCCIRLHISSVCPLTYTCTWTGCMWLWVGVFLFCLVFFYKLIVFYIMVYIEVYFCQSASNFNMTDN